MTILPKEHRSIPNLFSTGKAVCQLEEKSEMGDKQYNSSNKVVSRYLRKIKWKKVLWKLCAIPYSIFFANAISRILEAGTAGEVYVVVEDGILLCSLVLGYQLFSMLVNVVLEEQIAIGIQRCRVSFYERYFTQPLYRYQTERVGDILQNFRDDLDRLISKELNEQPNLLVGCIATVCYLGYLAFEHIGIAMLLLLISLFQIVPPFLVERYLDRFYMANEDVEEQETECIIMGYKNLACIKMFDLKKWYLGHLGELLKKIVKIATWNQIALQAENSLDRMLESVLRYGTGIGLGMMVLFKLIPMDVAVLALTLSGSLFSHVKSSFDTIPALRIAKTAQRRLDEWFQCKSIECVTCQTDKESLTSQRDRECVASQTDKVNEICINNYPHVILEENGKKLDRINFRRGDKIAFVGANGAGKTMLLKRIVGLLPEESGCLKIGIKSRFLFPGQL